MKKGLLFILAILGSTVSFAQEKPKNVSTELVQLKLEPRNKKEKQQVISEKNTKTPREVDIKQNTNKDATKSTPRKAELRVVPLKKKKPTPTINNK